MDVLCTVPEEFRNSKDGETSIPSTDFNQQIQVGDEQKPLDVGNAKQAEIKEQTTHKAEKLAVERLQER
ncbi:hypothetical protein DPMN_007015 [Dreissena polymorpha]|uniref:Uncharacterized protein n=1 Tax=Dreissena polymorpha TaxID=45954 RepID=A0A9D4RYB5_DREPO|nr:hypothetical protein DPMN_007015 [Dreissena polymorpha]